MARPKLQLDAKLRDALLSEADDWNSEVAKNASDLLDQLLAMMTKAAKEGNEIVVQRLGSTAGVLIDRIKSLRSSGDVKPPIVSFKQAQERLQASITKIDNLLSPQWQREAAPGHDNGDADGGEIN